MRKALAIVAALGCLATFPTWSACGGSVSDSGSGGAMICSPGATRTCVGPGACQGGQECAANGAAWGDCLCGTTDASATSSNASTGTAEGASTSASTGAGGQGGAKDGELNSGWTPSWSSILGYWKLDEAAGAATLADSSGHGNTARPMGGVHLGSPGALGKAAALDGSTGYIATPLNPVLASYTMAAWINPTQLPSTAGHEMRIFSNGCYGLCYTGAVDWGLSGVEIFILNQNNGNQDVFETNVPNPVTAGIWNHVSVVYSDSDHTTTNYVNGQLVAGMFIMGSSMRTPNPASTFAFNIGASGNPNQFFEGSIDDVAIWSTNLTAEDISTIYQHQQAAHGP